MRQPEQEKTYTIHISRMDMEIYDNETLFKPSLVQLAFIAAKSSYFSNQLRPQTKALPSQRHKEFVRLIGLRTGPEEDPRLANHDASPRITKGVCQLSCSEYQEPRPGNQYLNRHPNATRE